MSVILGAGTPKRKGVKRGAAVKFNKSHEVEYRKALLELTNTLKRQTALIGRSVSAGESMTQVQARVQSELQQANLRFNSASANVAQSSIATMDTDNRRKVEKALRTALGVSSASILSSDAVAGVIDKALAENVSLISSIPAEHFKKVQRAVLDNFEGKEFKEGSLINRLRALGSQSDKQAKLIARDQTAKFIGALNSVRQQDVGIERFIWRTVMDIRVTGAPGGPNDPSRAHGNHFAREGQTYRWDNLPADGAPGESIQCRCFAEPLIELEKVIENAI